LSFHDDFGMQRGIHYVSVPPEAVLALQSLDDPAQMLLGWLHEVAMPMWFSAGFIGEFGASRDGR
jgi:hypothetical protein